MAGITARLNLDTRGFARGAAQAERSVSDINDELRQTNKELDDANEGAGGFGGILDSIPGPAGDIAAAFTGPAGIVAGVGAAGLAAFELAQGAADAATSAQELANITGDSVEDASRLNAVWAQTGADAKDLQDVLLQMEGVLADDAELASELGINLNDGATSGERFQQVVDILNNIPDATRRGVIGSRLFGEEGVRQVNRLNTVVGDLDTALANVPDIAVIDDDEVDQALEFQRTWGEIQTIINGLVMEIGQGLIPAFQGAADALLPILEFADSNPFLTLEESASGLASGGLTAMTNVWDDLNQEVTGSIDSSIVYRNVIGELTDDIRDNIEVTWAQTDAGKEQQAQDNENAAAAQELRRENERVSDSIRDRTSAIQDAIDADRASLDPSFAVLQALDKQANAQDRVTELEEAGETSSREYSAALRDLALANSDLNADMLTLAEDGGDAAIETLLAMFDQGVLTEDQVMALAGEISNATDQAEEFRGEYVAKITADTAAATNAMNIWRSANDELVVAVGVQGGGGSVTAGGRTIRFRQQGGFLDQGFTMVGENGPELLYNGFVLNARATDALTSSLVALNGAIPDRGGTGSVATGNQTTNVFLQESMMRNIARQEINRSDTQVGIIR